MLWNLTRAQSRTTKFKFKQVKPIVHIREALSSSLSSLWLWLNEPVKKFPLASLCINFVWQFLLTFEAKNYRKNVVRLSSCEIRKIPTYKNEYSVLFCTPKERDIINQVFCLFRGKTQKMCSSFYFHCNWYLNFKILHV